MKALPPSQQLVTCLTLYPERCADKIFARIRPEMIYDPVDRDVFNKCAALHSQGEEISVTSLYNPNYVDRVTAFANGIVVDSVNVDAIMNQVVREFKRRRLRAMAGLIEQETESPACDVDAVLQIMNDARDDLELTAGNNFHSLPDIIDANSTPEAYQDMSETCIHTQWPDFDRKIIIKPGDLIVLAGRPSMGKTDFVLQLCKRMAQNRQPCAVFSLEMEAKYLNKRLSGGRDFLQYQQGCEDNADLPIYIDDDPVQNVYSALTQVSFAQKHYDIQLAVFDYLQIMDPPAEESRNRQIEELIKGLKQNARKTGVPHLVVSQLSRAVEQRNNKRPMLSDLRDSGAIEQTLDIALFLYRHSYYSDKADDNDLELIIGKQRDGATGVIKFFYDRISKTIECQSSGNIQTEVPF